MGNLEYEHTNFILDHAFKEQQYRKANNLPVKHWTKEDFEQMFHDWCAAKVKAFKGETVSGPGGWTQRSKA